MKNKIIFKFFKRGFITKLEKYGIMTIEDLRNYKPHIRKPVVGNYRGYDIFSMCPPSLGGIYLIQILNIIENYAIAPL